MLYKTLNMHVATLLNLPALRLLFLLFALLSYQSVPLYLLVVGLLAASIFSGLATTFYFLYLPYFPLLLLSLLLNILPSIPFFVFLLICILDSPTHALSMFGQKTSSPTAIVGYILLWLHNPNMLLTVYILSV